MLEVGVAGKDREKNLRGVFWRRRTVFSRPHSGVTGGDRTPDRSTIRWAASAHGKKTPISPLIRLSPAALASVKHGCFDVFFLFFSSLFLLKDEQIVRMCRRLATSPELRVSGSTRRAAEMGLGRLLCIRQPRGKIQTSTFFFPSSL